VGSTHHSKNVMTTSRPLELLHMDLFGPVAYCWVLVLKCYELRTRQHKS
jgi:hypothetical protein